MKLSTAMALCALALAPAFAAQERSAPSSSGAQRLRPTTADSDSGPEVQAVLARTDELNQAFVHSDVATLHRIIADECLQITQNGARTKAEWLAPFRSGASRFESIKPPEWRRVRLYGDVAVVTSAADIVMVVQGERRPSRFFNTRTWAKRSRQWYLVLAQNTARQEPADDQAIMPGVKADPGQTGKATDTSGASSPSLDAVTVESQHYKIDFENDRVRVVRVHYGPNEKSAIMHEHPGKSVEIYLTDFHANVSFPDGSTREVNPKAGKTMWRVPAVRHVSTENLSDQPMEALWVELKPRLGDTEANIALVRRYIEATNSRGHGDEAVIDEFIAPDFIRHGGKELRGRASFIQNGAVVQAAFPDWKWSIEDMLAEGDKVVVRMTGRGTQHGEFQGIPPTGKQVTLDVVMIYRISNGKIVEQWRIADDLGRLRQLGATISPPGQPK